ncbi:MAG: TetR family transcriptional regulator [Rhodospirillaceae bacterium]|nr:TetR family transcriptional regulator [Rhodospirillaceae bacterium]MCY4067057.1 TetR family transcriptional regulator [Rhodospirillaceae bacterium]
MPHRKTDRDAVIDAALELFRTRGYHHTSVAEIAAACGLLKGSVYHYFAGKQEIAAAALDRAIADSRQKIFGLAGDPAVPPPQRLRNLADAVERYFAGREGGCLMGSLALEVGDSIPEFRDRVQRYFDDWKAALAAVLEGRYGAARAGELAEDAIARAQGAILLMEVTKDPAVLQRACRDTVALLEGGALLDGQALPEGDKSIVAGSPGAAREQLEPWKEAS